MMRRLFIAALVLLSAVSSASAWTHGGSSGSVYNGFLDQYSAQGATFGWSTKKLSNAYGGNALVLERASDSTTQAVGWDSNGNANVSTFNTFCSGTTCYAQTLYDQVNGNNCTQSTLADMPQVILDTDNLLTIQPGPNAVMICADSSTYKTAKVELFAIVRPNYIDNRAPEPNVQKVPGSFTGTVTASSQNITGMNTQAGLLAGFNLNGATVQDANSYIPASTYIGQFLSGTSAQMEPPLGSVTNTSTEALTFYNPVIDGPWIFDGPTGATNYQNNAYWGFGTYGFVEVQNPRNGVVSGGDSASGNIYGEGQRNIWSVWDWDTFGLTLYVDGVDIFTNSTGSGNVTYSTDQPMQLFSDHNGQTAVNESFRQMVLFPATEASRVAMGGFLETQFGITNVPSSFTTADGFTLTPLYVPGSTLSADAYGLLWSGETGGYATPSIGVANNINNGKTLYQFTVTPGDQDVVDTAAQRAELAAYGSSVAPGGHASLALQEQITAMPSQTGSWCYPFQFHYGAGNTSPDILYLSCLNGLLQFGTQKTVSGSPVSTNQGSSFTLPVGTVLAYQIEISWSSNGTSDSLQIWEGVNGTSLTEIVNVTGSLWDQLAGGAYIKMGFYTGYPNQNPGPINMRVTNYQFSNTANAFSGFRTSQTALPTHP